MLPRENRLTKKKEFDRVLKKGAVIQSPSFGLFFVKEDDLAPSCFGIVISNKISRLANRRNRVKRIIREALRGLLARIEPGFSFVFLSRRSIIDRTHEELEVEIKDVLRRAGALRA